MSSFAAHDDALKLLAALGVATAGRIHAGASINPVGVASGAVQNTEYTLNTAVIPGGFLTKAGRAALIVATLVTAGNGDAKNVKVYLGDDAVVTITGSTLNAKEITIIALVVREAVNAQRTIALLVLGDGALIAVPLQATVASDQAEAADIAVTLKSANTGAAAASATGRALVVTLLGA